MATFNLVGLYEIIPSQQSLILAAKFHGYDWLLNKDGNYGEEIDWNEFKHLGLVEAQVFGDYSPGDLLSIHQNGQAPYLEFYLDPTGIKYLSEDAARKIDGRRVCFFLHNVDESRPLYIEEQEVVLPAMSRLPDRLVPFTHYVPVD